MRKVEVDLSDNIGIVEMNAAGNAYRVVWGFDDSGRPTSEFETHLLIHEVCSKLSGDDDRVVYHAHTPNITALTTAFVLDSRVLSRVLWKSTSECIIAAPEGVGLLPFTQPASNELAEKTAALMEGFRAVAWAGHGVIACSQTLMTPSGSSTRSRKRPTFTSWRGPCAAARKRPTCFRTITCARFARATDWSRTRTSFPRKRIA